VLSSGTAASQEVTLTREKIAAPAKARLGDVAAPLMVHQWIQGGPVDVKDGKGLTVVEFWATWCGPCRVSIPHLTALQKKLKDQGVRMVGISDEEPAKVKPFVEKMGATMGYAVACDDNRQTYSGYMDAFGYNSIPTAFIVGKDGRILWHGHPMAGLDQALERFLKEQPARN
jgi:thiol-disulfide isomerase/thioredoxin